jgi:hypothetical protein
MAQKAHIITLKNSESAWGLLDLKKVSDLAAIKWKLATLANMSDDKHKLALEKLKEVLSV